MRDTKRTFVVAAVVGRKVVVVSRRRDAFEPNERIKPALVGKLLCKCDIEREEPDER